MGRIAIIAASPTIEDVQAPMDATTTPPPFEQVKQQVSNGVMQKKLQAYVESLKKTAKIEKSL